jgi:hypothetical protein
MSKQQRRKDVQGKSGAFPTARMECGAHCGATEQNKHTGVSPSTCSGRMKYVSMSSTSKS